MTRRNSIYKWSIYALALLPIWLLDSEILSFYPLLGVIPILLPLSTVAVGVLEGSVAGARFGFAVGLLWATAYPSGNGFRILALTLIGLFVGIVAEYVLSQNFWGYFLCSIGALGVWAVLQLCFALFLQMAPPTDLLRITTIEMFWTLCWTPVVYLPFYLVFKQVGGTKLA